MVGRQAKLVKEVGPVVHIRHLLNLAIPQVKQRGGQHGKRPTVKQSILNRDFCPTFGVTGSRPLGISIRDIIP